MVFIIPDIDSEPACMQVTAGILGDIALGVLAGDTILGDQVGDTTLGE